MPGGVAVLQQVRRGESQAADCMATLIIAHAFVTTASKRAGCERGGEVLRLAAHANEWQPLSVARRPSRRHTWAQRMEYM